MIHDPTQTRPVPWRNRLLALIDGRQRQPFAWGGNDCCSFAADAVLAASGVDPAAEWRGTYADAEAAAALVQKLGGLDAIGALAGPGIAPMAAGLGDIGLVNDGQKELLAVCAGTVWVMPVARGLGALPLAAAVKAWRVAHA